MNTKQAFAPIETEPGQPAHFTLANVISQRLHGSKGWGDCVYGLTAQDRDDIVSVLGGNSVSKRAAYRLLRSISTAGSYWAWERIMCDGGRWSYCAGQDYPGELNEIRKYIRNRW